MITLYIRKAAPGLYYLYDQPSREIGRFAVGTVAWSKDARRYHGRAKIDSAAFEVRVASGTATSCLSRLMAELADRHKAMFKLENL